MKNFYNKKNKFIFHSLIFIVYCNISFSLDNLCKEFINTSNKLQYLRLEYQDKIYDFSHLEVLSYTDFFRKSNRSLKNIELDSQFVKPVVFRLTKDSFFSIMNKQKKESINTLQEDNSQQESNATVIENRFTGENNSLVNKSNPHDENIGDVTEKEENNLIKFYGGYCSYDNDYIRISGINDGERYTISIKYKYSKVLKRYLFKIDFFVLSFIAKQIKN